MDSSNKIAQYYNRHCLEEDMRLSIYSTEKLITAHLISDCISENCSVLDLGGGTGVYSIPLSLSKCNVTLVDLSENELDIAKSKAKVAGVKITTIEGDARRYRDNNVYDLVLCLGPLYHCQTMKDIDDIINTVLNQLKSGGIAVMSFISVFAKFNRFIQNVNKYTDDDIYAIKESWRTRMEGNDAFTFEYRDLLPISFVFPTQLNEFLSKYNVDIIDLLSVDICKEVSSLDFSKDLFELLSTFGRGYMLNGGEHIISIIKKV